MGRLRPAVATTLEVRSVNLADLDTSLPRQRIALVLGIDLIDPDAAKALFAPKVLRSHHRWVEVGAEHGEGLARPPVPGAYLVNTGENHSDLYGPYADWWRGFVARVNPVGTALAAGTAARFGLDLAALRAAGQFGR